MSRDDIIRLAREAGLAESVDDYNPYWTADDTDTLERFAKLIAEHEREECAKVCEAEGQRIDASWSSCAAAIRGRT